MFDMIDLMFLIILTVLGGTLGYIGCIFGMQRRWLDAVIAHGIASYTCYDAASHAPTWILAAAPATLAIYTGLLSVTILVSLIIQVYRLIRPS